MLLNKDNLMLPVYYPSTKEDFKDLIKSVNINILLDYNRYFVKGKGRGWRLLSVTSGAENKGKSPSDVIRKLDKKARGLNLIEGFWLIVAYPEILNDHAIDIIESKYSIECVPTFFKWKSKVYLSAICPDTKDKMCGAPIVKGSTKLRY